MIKFMLNSGMNIEIIQKTLDIDEDFLKKCNLI